MPRLLIAAILMALLSLGGTAQAGLPTFKTKTISGEAIGGVRLGMTFTQAEAVWGRGSVCTREETCRPLEENAPCVRETGPHFATCTWRNSAGGPSASVTLYDHKVVAIFISGPRKSAPGRLRTREGYGLGTPGSTLFTAGCQANSGSSSTYYTCRKVFLEVSRKSGRVVSVGIGRSVV